MGKLVTRQREGLEHVLEQRYELDRVLGHGGMGTVIKARDIRLGRDVAIKCLSEELFQVEEAVQIFLDEATALAKLEHPHLVDVYDIVEADDGVAMVQEYVRGGSLERVLMKDGPLDVPDVVALAVQLVGVAGYLHSMGYIHRDFKPANLLMERDGTLRLIDFGLARRFDRLNAKGTKVRGTPAYMAPEQIRSKELSPATDVYQIGVTLFELLTGQLPFETDGDSYSLTYAHVHDEPLQAHHLNPAVGLELSALLGDCLIKEPAARIATCRVFLERLAPIYESMFARGLDESGLVIPFADVGEAEAISRAGAYRSSAYLSVPNVRARSTTGQHAAASRSTMSDAGAGEDARISSESLSQLELRLKKLEEEKSARNSRLIGLVAIAVAVTCVAISALFFAFGGARTQDMPHVEAAMGATTNDRISPVDAPGRSPSVMPLEPVEDVQEDEQAVREEEAHGIAPSNPDAEPAKAPSVAPELVTEAPAQDHVAQDHVSASEVEPRARPRRAKRRRAARRAAPVKGASAAGLKGAPAEDVGNKGAASSRGVEGGFLDSFEVIDSGDAKINKELEALDSSDF